MKQAILDHFGGDFTGFYSRYLPDLRHGKANCPFHDCDSKSLSVEPKEGLFNCHFPGCAAAGDVFKFYGLKHNLNGDFPAVLRGIAADFGISENGAKPRKLVKQYAYRDAAGKILFYKNRYEPKAFDISNPAGRGMGGAAPELYNLPEVLKADEVWIVEGEKDADNLAALGFTTTTNFDGAGKWRESYTEALRGKTVFIIPDNDDEGRKHAQKVVRELQGRAKSIRLIEPPGLPLKGDVSDFLTSIGDPGHFKTFIELDRLLCIASGIDYHGHPVKQGTVFYIAGEGQQGIGRRLAAWHIAHKTKAADVPFFVAKVPTQLMDPAALDDVKRAVDTMAKEYGPPAVVHFDTLARNFGGGDENATKDMNAAISNLDKAFGSDFCRGLTHHTGHANKDRARGSMALHGAADGAFRVSLTPSGQIAVECKKLKDAPTPPLMVFSRQEVLLRIGDTEDRSYVLELTAEGDEAIGLVKPKKAAELKGGMAKAVGILRNLYERYGDNLKKSGRSTATPQVSYTDWRAACMDAGLYKHTDTFRRAFETILLKGLVELDESKKFVYLTDMVDENG